MKITSGVVDKLVKSRLYGARKTQVKDDRQVGGKPCQGHDPKDSVSVGSSRGGLVKKVGLTALGGGSLGGAVGFGIDLVRGQGWGGPAWASGVTLGLALGAVVGLASYTIDRAVKSSSTR